MAIPHYRKDAGFHYLRHELTPIEQSVYDTMLGFMNNQTRLAFPGVNRIAVYSNCSPASVRRALSKLRDNDYIRVVEKHQIDGGNTVYLITQIPIKPEERARQRAELEAKTEKLIQAEKAKRQ